MFRDLFAKLCRLRGTSPSKRLCRLTFRPRLEALGDRIVPDAYTWTGAVSTDATDIDNWFVTQEIIPGQPPPPPPGLPGADDYLTFSQYLGTTVDCDGLTGTFASMLITGDYNKTVSLGGSLTLGILNIAGGTIDQESSGDDITVTDDFDWTGGTINSTSNLASLILDGATGLIAPEGGGTVNLGSNIFLSNGTEVTMKEGTIERTNDDMVFEINEYCSVNFDPGVDKNIELTGDATIENGWLRIYGSATVTTGTYKDSATATNGGTFTLKPGTRAVFSGTATPAGMQTTWVYQQLAGSPTAKTILYGGSTLETDSQRTILIPGGELLTMADNEGNADATIKTYQLRITDGEIRIGAGEYPVYGKLTVQGAVRWTGGTYRPVVHDINQNVADKWFATGSFAVGGSATIAPICADDDLAPSEPLQAGMKWLIIESLTSVTADDNDYPDVEAEWCIFQLGVIDAGVVKEWYLKST